VTVSEFTSKALQMASYVQFGPPSPQSDLSKILARVNFRAGAVPDAINFSRCERSSDVSLTKYFWYIFLVLEWFSRSSYKIRACSELYF
jgi:hypothetical protein